MHARKNTEAIAKAVGCKNAVAPLTIIDATAGLGMDGFTLASLGCRVTMLERNPVLGLLLYDAIYRYKACYERDVDVSLQFGDARQYLCMLSHRVNRSNIDVVYLDPMYPQQQGKTALNQAAMRVVRLLVGHDDDTQELFKVALQVATKRVVVKRPSYAPYLADIQPSFSIGKCAQHRFDVYLPVTSYPL